MKSSTCLAAFLLLSLSAGADELLTNGDFEDVKDPLGGWTVSVEGATAEVKRIGTGGRSRSGTIGRIGGSSSTGAAGEAGDSEEERVRRQCLFHRSERFVVV